MTLLLRKLLSRYFSLCVVGEADPEQDPGLAADAGGTGDETLDDLIDAAGIEEDPAPAPKKTARELELERDLENERTARRRDAEYRQTPAPTHSRGDPTEEAEDRELADMRSRNVDAATLAARQWQITANRTLRNTTGQANAALNEARDIADRTAFDRLEVTKPKFFKRYGPQVEQMIAAARAKGEPTVPRIVLLKLLVGGDLVDGKIGSKPKPKAEAPDTTQRVPRGRSPLVRTDVGARGKPSEREARRERLKGQLI